MKGYCPICGLEYPNLKDIICEIDEVTLTQYKNKVIRAFLEKCGEFEYDVDGIDLCMIHIDPIHYKELEADKA